MHLLILLVASVLLTLANAFTAPVVHRNTLNSRSESSPNSIASLYPNSVTGTINGTISVVPIPYKLARSIIPSKYKILKKAYRSLLPGFPHDSYPLIVRAGFDHGVGIYAGNISVPDFQKVLIYYPFIDRLGDGYSSFAYELYILLSSDNLIAQQGAAAYGQIPIASNFTPFLDAYGFRNECKSEEIFSDAYTNLSSVHPGVTTKFKPTRSIAPWPLEFYVNVTNQPSFANDLGCDNQINLFNTTLSTGTNKPVGIRGEVMIKAPYIPSTTTFRNIHGIKVDIAFIENNLLPCEQLKGYSGTGPGD